MFVVGFIHSSMSWASSDDPASAGGIGEPTSYHRNGIDNVNLSNGGVSLFIPIASFVVNGGFEYSIGLHYNSSVWYFLSDGETCLYNDPNGGQQQITEDAWVMDAGRGRPNIGPMWRLGLGPWLQNGALKQVDGSEVKFHDDGLLQTVTFSTDGSHMRKRDNANAVDAPSGVVYSFENVNQFSARPASAADPFGQTVLSYAYNQGTDTDETHLTDLAGREIVMDWGDMELRYPVAHGNTATIRFETETRQVYRRGAGPDHNPYACQSEFAQEGEALTFLTGIVLADGSRFTFDYYTDEEPLDGGNEAGAPGYLKEMILPSSGVYQYRYQLPSDQVLSNNPISRLSSKSLFIGPNDTSAALWRYSYSSQFAAGHTTVRDPIGNETVHHFDTRNIGAAEPGWKAFWFRGMNFNAEQSITSSRGHKLYLSSETYQGTAANGTLLRENYVRYEADDPTQDPFLTPGISPGEKEKRLAATATRYFDEDTDPDPDYQKETLNSNWDGFGHWRQTEIFDDSGAPSTVAYTAWNVHLDPSSKPEQGTWLLNTHAYKSVTRDGQTTRTDYHFDTETGFLECMRSYREFGQSATVRDLVEVRTLDANNNLGEIRLLGADVSPLNSVSGCHTGVGTATFRKAYAYTDGVLRRESILDPASGALVLRTFDREIDYHTGKVRSETDPSGLLTGYGYDSMGRLTHINPPGDLPGTSIEYCTATRPNCVVNRVIRKVHGGAPGNGYPLTRTLALFDGLGRKVEERMERVVVDADTRQELKTRFAYDDLDRLTDVTPTDLNPDTFANALNRRYDRFGRVTRVIQHDDSTVWTAYAGDRGATLTYKVVTEEGEKNYTRTVARGDYRNLVTQVSEPSKANGSTQSTSYQYDVNGHLTGVSTGVQARTFSYDALGWQKSASHPELDGVTISSSNHDVLANAHTTETGARSLNSTYDPAGRLVSVASGARPLSELYRENERLLMAKRHNYIPRDPNDPDSGEDHYVVTERMTYNQSTGLMTDLSASIVQFDASGTQHVRPDRYFEQRIVHNTDGLPALLRYPDGRLSGVDHTPTEIGMRYKDLTPVEVYNAATAQNEVEFTYHRGAVRTMGFGNNVTQTVLLDGSGMMRTGSISITDPDGDELWGSGGYQYDGSGNIHAIGDDTFRYDGVHRLTSSNVSGVEQSAAYDAFGNITSITTAGSQALLGIDALTNRLQSVPGATFAYDGFGNMAQWKSRGFVYDAYDMVVASALGDQVRQYVYGPDNKRIATVNPSTEEARWTLRSPSGKVLSEFEDVSGGLRWQRDYVYSGGQLVAAYHEGDTRYFHADHLGSTRLVTDTDGVSVARYDYHPFGGFAAQSGAEADLENLLFTGHERDRNDVGDEDDLDYMMARYYAPHLGRFLSVDPVLGDAEKPQSWNRYAYVRNNPVRLNDPTGMCANGDVSGPSATADTAKCLTNNADEALTIKVIVTPEAGMIRVDNIDPDSIDNLIDGKNPTVDGKKTAYHHHQGLNKGAGEFFPLGEHSSGATRAPGGIHEFVKPGYRSRVDRKHYKNQIRGKAFKTVGRTLSRRVLSLVPILPAAYAAYKGDYIGAGKEIVSDLSKPVEVAVLVGDVASAVVQSDWVIDKLAGL